VDGRRALAGVVVAAAAYAGYRRWQTRWGATAEEVGRPLPGDDLVSRPWFDATNVVEIGAEPDRVWPWLAQMGGYGRAGWYSYDRFDNAGRPSADRVVPELQDLRVGDVMATSPDGSGFVVRRVEPGRCLVLEIRAPEASISSAFLLDRVAPGRTRLINRVRYRFRPTPRTLPLAIAMDVGHFVMARRMLLGIRRRAEGLARRTGE
jgi:hypothetical protein